MASTAGAAPGLPVANASPSRRPSATRRARGSASSINWRSSRAGSFGLTGWGMAPSFQAAAAATRNSSELGRAMVTMEPWVTPESDRCRARRLAEASSSARVSRSGPQVIASRSGSAAARSVMRRPKETAGPSHLAPTTPRIRSVRSTTARLSVGRSAGEVTRHPNSNAAGSGAFISSLNLRKGQGHTAGNPRSSRYQLWHPVTHTVFAAASARSRSNRSSASWVAQTSRHPPERIRSMSCMM